MPRGTGFSRESRNTMPLNVPAYFPAKAGPTKPLVSSVSPLPVEVL